MDYYQRENKYVGGKNEMNNILSNELRIQYGRVFATVKAIIDAFPESKWLEPHGDIYYIPSRIAYHIVEYIRGAVLGEFKDPDFRDKSPFGSWMTEDFKTLPNKDALIGYFTEVTTKAQGLLESLVDENLSLPMIPEMARFGSYQFSLHLAAMREISAHTGELNKMLVENGIDDIWISR